MMGQSCSRVTLFFITRVFITRILTRTQLSRCILRLKCDGTRAETRFCLSAKRTSPFKSSRALVQSTTASRGVCISGSNAGCTMIQGGVKGTGYPLHSPVSHSLPLPCVTVCHHVSTGLLAQLTVPDLCFKLYHARFRVLPILSRLM